MIVLELAAGRAALLRALRPWLPAIAYAATTGGLLIAIVGALVARWITLSTASLAILAIGFVSLLGRALFELAVLRRQ